MVRGRFLDAWVRRRGFGGFDWAALLGLAGRVLWRGGDIAEVEGLGRAVAGCVVLWGGIRGEGAVDGGRGGVLDGGGVDGGGSVGARDPCEWMMAALLNGKIVRNRDGNSGAAEACASG